MAVAGGLVEEPAEPAIQRLHPIRTHLGRSIVVLAAGLAVAGVTAVALKRFYDSLGVAGTALTIWAVGLALLAAAVAVVLATCGSMAVVRSVRAGRLIPEDRVAARVSGAAATDWLGGDPAAIPVLTP